ncbi:MAG: hypothetical protein EOO13_08665 [Chitinophagaceae bacterium]|nr:MAG: hypothetical protein EOO13_08665 [Chitinophagaceae bacterium]
MKKLTMMLLLFFAYNNVMSQIAQPQECSMFMRKTAKAMVDQALKQERITGLGQRASLPYTMRIQVVVFSASSPTVTNADIHRNIANMANFYRPQNICFILSDIEYVQDATMANFHTDNESSLISYTRPSYLSIFIHNNLADNLGTLNGIAYEIPNTYLSIVDDAILSTTNVSTLAHEMGHCFGLYHTFESLFGSENGARSGPCRNCETTGDYLCDTQADRNVAETSITVSCIYDGTATSGCDNSALIMEPRNIMTYGRRTCRDQFTNGQGGRARDHILTETSLFNCIAPDVITLTTNTNYSGGGYSLTAKDWINIASPSYQISGSAQMRITSGSIRLGPGVALRPTGINAIVALKTNAYCE